MIVGKLYTKENEDELSNADFFRNDRTNSLLRGSINGDGDWIICNMLDTVEHAVLFIECTLQYDVYKIRTIMNENDCSYLYDGCIRMIINHIFHDSMSDIIIEIDMEDTMLVDALIDIEAGVLKNTDNYKKFSVNRDNFYQKLC